MTTSEETMPTPRIPIPYEEVAAFCRKWSITELALFGSVLREDFTPESDVDVLARFGPDAERSFGAFMRAQDELAAMLGRKVDLVEWQAAEESPNYYRRKAVLDSAQVIYDAA